MGSVCEKEANESLMEVRKFVTARQIEAKGKDASVEVSTELIKFQTRLSTAQSEVSKQRKLFTSVEQRLAVKRVLDEAEKKLAETEEKVGKAMAAISGLEDLANDGADKAIKDAELAVQEASISVRTTSRFMEAQSRTQGFAKDSIAKLEPRVKECQDKLASAQTLIKERTEKIFVNGILQEAEAKVSECEGGLKKASEVEAPFLEGDDSAEKAAKGSIADLEKALQAAQSLATAAKTFISMKRLAVKRLTDSAGKASNAGLTKLQASGRRYQEAVRDAHQVCRTQASSAQARGSWSFAARGSWAPCWSRQGQAHAEEVCLRRRSRSCCHYPFRCSL